MSPGGSLGSKIGSQRHLGTRSWLMMHFIFPQFVELVFGSLWAPRGGQNRLKKPLEDVKNETRETACLYTPLPFKITTCGLL